MSITWDWGDDTVEPGGSAAAHTYADLAGHVITATDSAGLTGTTSIGDLPFWDVAVWDLDTWGA